jgi:putative RNA 2'-phosphotransferase
MGQTETGRFISLILRHKPEVAGVTLDGHGWADVGELIKGVNRTHAIDMAFLQKIVAEDSKQRFSFNEDKTKIRANQGHSINVDVELKKMAPPDFLWHGTGKKYVGEIKLKGLLPMTRLYVHLSVDYDTALKVGSRHGEPIVFKIDAKAMKEDGFDFYKSLNGIWLTKVVPVKYMQIE